MQPNADIGSLEAMESYLATVADPKTFRRLVMQLYSICHDHRRAHDTAKRESSYSGQQVRWLPDSVGSGNMSSITVFPNNTSVVSAEGFVVPHTEGAMEVADGGQSILGDYEIAMELGRGSFGVVHLAFNGDGEPFAIKSIPRQVRRALSNATGLGSTCGVVGSGGPELTTVRVNAVDREIALMKRLCHKNLVRLHAVIEDVEDGQCHLVMQFIENGALATVKRDGTCTAVPVEDTLHYMIQVSAGLDYLHRHNIIHRDIKPENILIDNGGLAYVADFGVSVVVDEESKPLKKAQGTLAFFAPELIEDAAAAATYGKESDAWAFGVTLYSILYGKLPFQGWNAPSMIRSICNDDVSIPEDTDVPKEVEQLVMALLDKNPSTRMKLKQFRSKARVLLRLVDEGDFAVDEEGGHLKDSLVSDSEDSSFNEEDLDVVHAIQQGRVDLRRRRATVLGHRPHDLSLQRMSPSEGCLFSVFAAEQGTETSMDAAQPRGFVERLRACTRAR